MSVRTGFVFMGLIFISPVSLAVCPSADISGDCYVNMVDFAIMACQWLEGPVPEDPNSMDWVTINDPGVPDHEAFNGQMSKYETTNGQYCQYLNSALSESLITVYNGTVYAVSDPCYNEPYFDTYQANSHSQIVYSDGAFSVRIRDGYDMSNHPIVEVSWYGATAFCDYYGYRLPTEWEWQAVADYDGTFNYGCGTVIYIIKATYGSVNPLALTSYPYTSPVGYYLPYGYGICDLAGNSLEWTNSCLYPDCEFNVHRVKRGGDWASGPNGCAVIERSSDNPSTRNDGTGFRPVRDLP
ncbi:MAG: SUMF1/EgtB/PvdO family nonheme iron enzyme [Sedimentisphaerales bacterium]|nr:SUMF1/EgtB/PvdO family nonheme iron enzyme [Sedimentisphaerales bacterium]